MTIYRDGYELERAARKDYEARGWFVVRSGGSKGVADLVAIELGDDGSPAVHLVQCKLDGYLLPAERKQLQGVADSIGAWAYVAYWHKPGRAARTVAFREA
jgi:Holliday junction resolvase